MKKHFVGGFRWLAGRRTGLGLALLLVALFSGVCPVRCLRAEETPAPNRDAQVEGAFKEHDKNADGVLTPEEVGDAALFQQMDTNNDGVVTREEAKAHFARPAQAGPNPDAGIEQSFKNHDKNGDGLLGPEEVGNPETFKQMDTDQDGAVTLEEVKAFLARRAGNGGPAQPGANREAQIERGFQQRDKNGDGLLSPEEVGNPGMFRQMDANNDGFVSLEEAKATLLRQTGAAPPAGRVGPDQSFTPLTDLGPGQYQGFPGGLYPDGANTPPAAYLQQGLTAAQAIQPLDQAGQPDPNGCLVLLSIGMSNTTMEFSTFKQLADADPEKNPRLVIVDGAFPGQDAARIKDPAAPYWTEVVAKRLAAAGVSPAQVQVVWLKQAIAGENKPFPADAQELQGYLAAIVQILQQRLPNLKIIYVSSRIYAGYATTPLNPEPYAYQSGFAVKWLIEDRIKNAAEGPWVAWGPYLWTDGVRGRKDGLVWNREDVVEDGTHPSPSGREKVAKLLLQFFKTDETAKGWFVKAP